MALADCVKVSQREGRYVGETNVQEASHASFSFKKRLTDSELFC